MAGPSLSIKGGREFRAALKAVDRDFPKMLAKAHRVIAQDVGREARNEAGSLDPIQRAAARAIMGSGTQAAARIQVDTRKVPFGNVAFWGSKSRTGWYAAPRFEGGAPQSPPWVGNSWQPGEYGEGPYAINDTIARMRDRIIDEYGDALMDIARQAFPT